MVDPIKPPAPNLRAKNGPLNQATSLEFQAEGMRQVLTFQDSPHVPKPAEQQEAKGDGRESGKYNREHRRCHGYRG